MIRELKLNEIKEAASLIMAVYNESEYLNDTKRGRLAFKEIYCNSEHLAKMVSNSELEMFGYFIDDKLCGVISLDSNATIMHLFVDMSYNKRGIAHSLLDYVFLLASKRGIKILYLDSSKYALDFYLRRGFKKREDEKCEDGMVYTPMYYEL